MGLPIMWRRMRLSESFLVPMAQIRSRELNDQLNSVRNAASLSNKNKQRRGKKKGRQVDLEALAAVQQLLEGRDLKPDQLIENLHILQDHHGALFNKDLLALAEAMSLSAAEVFEVASFYHHFDLVADGEQAPAALTVRVCDSVSCCMAGAESLASELDQTLGSDVRVQRVPCVGRCAQAPVAVVGWQAIGEATVADVTAAVESENTAPNATDSALSLAAYCDAGGYSIYQRLVDGELSGDALIECLEGAGLRGLGGAGFPAGRKWRILRDQPAPRLMAINIDEGEPGTFKDRHYLEQDPHRLL